MKPILSLLALTFTLPPLLAGPSEAIAAALFDARKLPPGVRENTRYLALPDEEEEIAADWYKVLSFHTNQLSRELDIVRPRRINRNLFAVNLLDYQWDKFTWEKLSSVEPYFYRQAVPDRFFWPGDKTYPAGWYRNTSKQRLAVFDPYLPAAVLELVLLTQSGTPIVRADWWFAQTITQDGREGTGYYDFLGLGKKLTDFESLVGLDRKLAARLRKETAAIVSTSTVALHNRQIFRFQTLTGPYWETLDVKESTGQKNALRFLNGDFRAATDASEIYGTLPNGLFAFFLADAKGNRANSAPDFIASDGRSTSSDRRVLIGISCIRCHQPGIQPIDDWGRKAYAAPDALTVVGEEKYRRLKQLYLSELERHIRRDQQDYADVLKAVNGLTPQENSRLVAWAWERYVDRMVTLETAARDLGSTPEKVTATFREYGTFPRVIDPVLFSLGKGIPVSRKQLEELYGTAREIMALK